MSGATERRYEVKTVSQVPISVLRYVVYYTISVSFGGRKGGEREALEYEILRLPRFHLMPRPCTHGLDLWSTHDARLA